MFCGRTIASFRAYSKETAIQHFLLKCPVFCSFLKVISSCLRLLPRLSIPYVSFSNECWNQLLCEMWHIHFTFFILCIIDNQFATLNQKNAQNISLDTHITISHWVFLPASIHKESSWLKQTKSIQHETKLITRHSWHVEKGSDI